ncbi:MAG: glycosyl hydrolase [Sulfurimonas sp.]|jgi:hypothetical protein|nr:glycosyl hydrolase [Sulfurimonas sp.]
MKKPYEWDQYSDQPYPLQDKSYKRMMRKRELRSLVRTFLTSLVVLPVSILMLPFVKRKLVNSRDFFCMGVDFQREAQETLDLIEDLGVERILLRYKLWESDSLSLLQTFIATSQARRQKKVTLKILQDREHVEDLELLEKDLRTLFSTLQESVDLFEIGSTINRAKWGFFSVDEYIKFYQVAYRLQQEEFPSIKLIGSGVIDFEYHFTSHTLFNLQKYRYDGVSALLYVDRRGAPENTQMGFSTSDKIALLSTMVWLSPKTKHKLHITETNWPISNTAPYAPTSEYECVSEDLYTDYMLRYHYFAFASQQVDTLSWHQLIAPGYGLIDTREGLRKRSAYQAYKVMYHFLKDAKFLRLDIKRDYYILQCLVNSELLQIHWSLRPTTLKNENFFRSYSCLGHKITTTLMNIGSSPIYIFIQGEVQKESHAI